MAVKKKEPAGHELERINWIRRQLERAPSARFPLGLGDDCALWSPARGSTVVLTVDAQVEEVHFRRRWLSLRTVGRRAVHSSASDLAAMAARPAAILVSLILPAELADRELRALYGGILEAAGSLGLRILGGNLSEGPLSLTITVLGEGRRRELKRRDGARPGDLLWVTGTPGLARLGLLCHERGKKLSRGGGSRAVLTGAERRAREAFARPTARIREALSLARVLQPSAMIDLSDGLAADLRHVLEESSRATRRPCGAVLDESALVADNGYNLLARALRVDPAREALGGGEDYELLLAVPPSRGLAAKARAVSRRLGLALRCVGEVTRAPGLLLRGLDGNVRRVTELGWEH